MRLILVLLAALFLPIRSWGQETVPSKDLKIGSETVKVYYAVSNYYLLKKENPPKGGVPFEATFGFIRLQHNEKNLDQNRFLTLGETKRTFRFQSSDEEVLHITNSTRDTGFPYEPGTVIARKPGRVVVTVTADTYEVKIPITVHGLPIFKGDVTSLVIIELGEPDNDHEDRDWYYDVYPDLRLNFKKVKRNSPGNFAVEITQRVVDTVHPYTHITRIGNIASRAPAIPEN